MENGKVFFKSLPPPPHKLYLIFMNEVDTTNGVLFLGGVSYTNFGTWGRGDKDDTK